MLKISLFLRNLQTSRAINSIILRIKNVKFSGYCFYMETNSDFQICISVPLLICFLNTLYYLWVSFRFLQFLWCALIVCCVLWYYSLLFMKKKLTQFYHQSKSSLVVFGKLPIKLVESSVFPDIWKAFILFWWKITWKNQSVPKLVWNSQYKLLFIWK